MLGGEAGAVLRLDQLFELARIEQKIIIMASTGKHFVENFLYKTEQTAFAPFSLPDSQPQWASLLSNSQQ